MLRPEYRLIGWSPDRRDTVNGPTFYADLSTAREEALGMARETNSNVTVARLSHRIDRPDRAVIYCTPDGKVYPS